MDNFWIWLKRANARAVFFCLLIALMTVTAWWGWKLTTPIRTTPSPATGIRHDRPTPGLGLLAYLRAQQTAGTSRAADLFTPADAPSSPIKPPKPEVSDPPPKPEAPVPVPKPTPTPTPRREIVRVTYRGLMVRGDGVPVALISDSRSGHSAFYAQGTNLFGLILTTIEAETLGMSLPDHSSITLKRGISQSLPETRHAN